MNKLLGQKCPFCNTNNMSLSEEELNIPSFGKVFLFNMNCSNCNYNKRDVESEDQKGPIKITITIDKEDDMRIKVLKSSEATIKIPQMKITIEPGPGSMGYMSNVEGILEEAKKIIEDERDASEDDDSKKSAKNLLKKLWKAKLGDIPLKIIIEDPTGNSAIISKKAIVERLKVIA